MRKLLASQHSHYFLYYQRLLPFRHIREEPTVMAVIHAGQIVRNGDWLMANITVTMVEVRVPQVEHPHHQRVDPQHHLQVHRNLFRRQNQRLKFRHSRKLIMQKKGLRMDIRSK